MCTGMGIGWSCLQRKEGHREQRHNSSSDWSRTSLPSLVYKRTAHLSHHVCTREQHTSPITCVQENSTPLPSHVYKRTPQLSHHMCTREHHRSPITCVQEISTSLPSHVYKRTAHLSHHMCTRKHHSSPITCVQENTTALPSHVYKRTPHCISKRGTWMESQTSLMPARLTLEPLVSCFTSKVGRAYVILSCPAACKQDVAQEVTIQHRK